MVVPIVLGVLEKKSMDIEDQRKIRNYIIDLISPINFKLKCSRHFQELEERLSRCLHTRIIK